MSSSVKPMSSKFKDGFSSSRFAISVQLITFVILFLFLLVSTLRKGNCGLLKLRTGSVVLHLRIEITQEPRPWRLSYPEAFSKSMALRLDVL
jgi:hypothetical protein